MRHVLCFVAIILLGMALSVQAGPGPNDEAINQCVLCHTTPALLVPAVREAEKALASVNRDLPGASIVTEGEG